MFSVDLTGREARESGVSSVIVDDTGENCESDYRGTRLSRRA